MSDPSDLPHRDSSSLTSEQEEGRRGGGRVSVSAYREAKDEVLGGKVTRMYVCGAESTELDAAGWPQSRGDTGKGIELGEAIWLDILGGASFSFGQAEKGWCGDPLVSCSEERVRM
jgi:hypothetical protein